MSLINLKSDSYLYSKILNVKSNVLTNEEIEKLKNHSFDEILLKLNDSSMDFKIDKNYLKHDGFFLIEKIINEYIQNAFLKLLKTLNKNNSKFFNIFYKKFLIENFLKILKIKHLNSKEDITPFLVGLKEDKEFFLEASHINDISKLFEFCSKKIGFDKSSYEVYKKGLLEVENYIYKSYYNSLFDYKFKGDTINTKMFFSYLKNEIDIVNVKTFFICYFLKENKIKTFESIFIDNGNLKKEFLIGLFSKNEKDTKESILNLFKKKLNYDFSKIDIELFSLRNKKSFIKAIKKSKFNSVFFILKTYFEIEDGAFKIKKMLKAKYLNISQENIYEVLK